MSWSTSSIAWPASARLRRRRPSSSLSCVSRPAAGSSRQTSRGFATSARAIPTSLRCPCESSFGSRVGDRLEPEQLQRRADLAPVPGSGRETVSRIVRQTEGRCEATKRFSRTERSSKSSIDCHVRASPRRARTCGGSRVRSCPSSSTRPPGADEAADRVDERRLAGAVRADQADELPSPTSRSTSTTACTPPKLTEIPVACEDRRHRVPRAAARHVGGARPLRAGGRSASSRRPSGRGG